MEIIGRIVKVHSSPSDLHLDFFAGSWTLSVAAAKNARGFILVDNNRAAVEIMADRLQVYEPDILINAKVSELGKLRRMGKIGEFANHIGSWVRGS